MFKKIFLIAIVCMTGAAQAQELPKSSRKQFNTGLDLFVKERYPEALNEFLKVGVSNYPDLNYYIGVTYLNLRNPDKAVEYLSHAKLFRIDIPEVDYYLGRAFHLKHDFEKAHGFFEEYKNRLNEGQRVKKAEADVYITYCLNGLKLMETPVEIEINPMGDEVNSEFPEYNPVISADETFIAFTSRRPDTRGKKLDPRDLLYYEDIYVSEKDSLGDWSPAVSIGNRINSENHDACIGLSADGQQMLIYNASSNGGDIYISTLDGKDWSNPKDLGKNINSPYWESSASLSTNNNVLFFSSNRKGGMGGTDIYMSKRGEDGAFGPAILLGPQVNTPGDEIAPFIHADGQTLYFSSRGHRSMGGFDIFSVQINMENGEILSDAENIGFPVNTADDDFNFAWSPDNSRAYFSSIRPGGKGDKDIYMLEREVKRSSLVVWKGSVHDCATKQTVPATITISDNATKAVIGVYAPNKTTGKYTVILPEGRNYNIAVEAPMYAFYSKNIDIPQLDTYTEIEEEICLEAVSQGASITLRNIFFDFDKATLRRESEIELERLHKFLTDHPKIRLEIAGHTDSDGDEEYNDKLSARRADAVYYYLIEKGIKADRLETKGFGESQPIATNETEEGRQLNRRTTVTVLK